MTDPVTLSENIALYADLAHGGVLWFTDLTKPDSTRILPVVLATANLINVEVAC